MQPQFPERLLETMASEQRPEPTSQEPARLRHEHQDQDDTAEDDDRPQPRADPPPAADEAAQQDQRQDEFGAPTPPHAQPRAVQADGQLLYRVRRAGARAEERRVGKECRSRWSP